MKILLVSPFTSQSGSAIRFWNIAIGLRAAGLDVVYSDRAGRGSAPLYRKAGITYCPSPRVPSLVLDILVSTVYSIVLLLRNLDASLYYALKPAPNNCCAALLARFLGKKIILDIDDLDYEYLRPGLKRSLSKFSFALFPRFFPLITCHTPNLRSYCTHSLGISEDRLYFLAQGVSQEFLQMRVPQSGAAPEKSILYVATLGITSDFGDLLPALKSVAASHPDARTTVVGDGIRRKEFEGQARAFGLQEKVVFTGLIPHERLPALMARHRIGLNYMRSTFVNNCRAILKIREYLACGLQVVCNRSGDADLFSEFIFVEPDLDGIERRLKSLLSSAPEAKAGGRRFIEREYSWESITSGLVAHLNRTGILPDKGQPSDARWR